MALNARSARAFASASTMSPATRARQRPVDDVEDVRQRVVQAEPRLEAIREEREPARHEEALRAGRVKTPDHALGAGRKAQALVVHALQRVDGQASQKGYALLQARAEVDLSAHRAFRDACHRRLDAEHVGDLVDAFDRDQRRVHVHRHHAHVREAQVAGDEGMVDAVRRRDLGDAVAILRIAKPERRRAAIADRRDRARPRRHGDFARDSERRRRTLHDEIDVAARNLAHRRIKPSDARCRRTASHARALRRSNPRSRARRPCVAA